MDLGCLDLGCLDLGCIDKKTNSAVDALDSLSSATKPPKNKSPKGSPPSGANALNRLTSLIKKPPHRKTSPVSWFPRKKTDSFLDRKIKLLQESGGMNDTLDETLGHANPHYCKVEREKMATREAVSRVMNARKAAMVEASWCRILQAARIPTKEAEALLLKAEKEVTEAVEAATAKGVIMYDSSDHPRKHFEIETSSVGREGTKTHTVKAAFETAFDVDKQVAAAVKAAFIRLAHYSSFNKDEFKALLRNISENPDTHDLSASDTGLEFEGQDDGCNSQKRHNRKKLSPQKFNRTKLVRMMLERLKCLKEDELASLATIVATCGLNAALAETQNKDGALQKVSSSGVDYFVNREMKQKQAETELPSLDKFLVKKLTRLEREVQEAKNARNAESNRKKESTENCHPCSDNINDKPASVDEVPDLESVLAVKHSSKLEKEIEEAKRNQKLQGLNGKAFEGSRRHGIRRGLEQEDNQLPSLDQLLVRHVSKLEKAVQDAKNKSKDSNVAAGENASLAISQDQQIDKENVDSNSLLPLQSEEKNCISSADEKMQAQHANGDENLEEKNGLDKIFVKPVSRLEREKMNAMSQGVESDYWSYKKPQKTNNAEVESLDSVLVKHVSRLEKAKTERGTFQVMELKRRDTTSHTESQVGGLDQVLIKHRSRLERDKDMASHQAEEGVSSHMSRRQARERELQEAWGGFGLGNSMKPHVSRLEREKAAWLKAEEDERKASNPTGTVDGIKSLS